MKIAEYRFDKATSYSIPIKAKLVKTSDAKPTGLKCTRYIMPAGYRKTKEGLFFYTFLSELIAGLLKKQEVIIT
jgi:hypothetical protein